MAVSRCSCIPAIAVMVMVSTVSAFQLGADPGDGPRGAQAAESVTSGGIFQYDDGTSEGALGLVLGGELAWLQCFDAGPGGAVISHVDVAVGLPGGTAPPAGGSLTVYVWDDPNSDGEPSDAVLLGSGTGVIASPGTDTLVRYALDQALVVQDGFFVGAMTPHASGEFPAALDTSVPPFYGVWLVGSTTGNFNPDDLTSNDVRPTDVLSTGFIAVWLVRAGGEGWADLGSPLSGSGGLPVLQGTGSTSAGQTVTVMVSRAAANANSTMVLGLSALGAPFKGGVLLPSPDLILGGLTTDSAGKLALSGVWPAVLGPGQALYFQAWTNDVVGPAGFSASNGLAGTTL